MLCMLRVIPLSQRWLDGMTHNSVSTRISLRLEIEQQIDCGRPLEISSNPYQSPQYVCVSPLTLNVNISVYICDPWPKIRQAANSIGTTLLSRFVTTFRRLSIIVQTFPLNSSGKGHLALAVFRCFSCPRASWEILRHLRMSQDALGQLKHLKTTRARWPFPDATSRLKTVCSVSLDAHSYSHLKYLRTCSSYLRNLRRTRDRKHPIVLEGYKKDEFSCLLKSMYPTYVLM